MLLHSLQSHLQPLLQGTGYGKPNLVKNYASRYLCDQN